MSGSVNKVILVGNLGQDPEIRHMQNGNPVCNLSVATSERWKGQDGNMQERTEWTRVVIFDDKIAEVCGKYLKKGSKVFLEGQLQTRKWTDQSGADKYTTEVVLQKFRGNLVMLGDKSDGLTDVSGNNQSNVSGNAGSSSAPPAGDLSDQIPFAPHRGL